MMIGYSVFLNGCLVASRQGKNQPKIDAAQQQRDRPAILAAIRRASYLLSGPITLLL
jgi:hypothetical protein